jgi:hypothetical protein
MAIPDDIGGPCFLPDEEPSPLPNFVLENIGAVLPTFPLPFRILNCYIDELLQLRSGEDALGYTNGITTS